MEFIEEYIKQEVLPLYANTHTTTTVTAQQTTNFRNEARSIIRGAVNACSESDVVIFTGSGSTGAIHKLISSLYLDKLEERPLVFNSGQEHHSNLLPWREVGCEMVKISELPTGEVNAEDLERKLSSHRKQSKTRLIIGLFSAASNVSGILNDDLLLTSLMHKYEGLAFWDYATAAPYVNIDMNPSVEEDSLGFCNKDAVYFSMHKFVGGPQTPGILIAKKDLFKNPVPHLGGGGTVLYVTEKSHNYVAKIEDREEGGTPAILESIRAGLTMFVKENVGSEFIMQREEKLMEKALERLSKMDNLVVLGPNHAPKLPVLSFLIKCPEFLGNGFLHHNFICFVLNDVFGIQARGGCACAGPYVEGLLGMSEEKVKAFTGLVQGSFNGMNPYANTGPFERIKPGFSRLNLPWFAPDEEIDYILDALEMTAKNGWKLLPQYEFNSQNGEWTHVSKIGKLEKKFLNDLDLFEIEKNNNTKLAKEDLSWTDLKIEAEKIFSSARQMAKRVNVQDQRSIFATSAKIRWFILPYEAKQGLLTPNAIPSSRKINSPFWPKKFQKSDKIEVGSYSGRLIITPELIKILAPEISAKFLHQNPKKMWFHKNFFGTKTMTDSNVKIHEEEEKLRHSHANYAGGSFTMRL